MLKPGEVVITATQEAMINYRSGFIRALLTIPQLSPIITNFTIPDKTYLIGDTIELRDPSSNSSGTFSYSSLNTKIATISGFTVTILKGGSVVIKATQAETVNYRSGSVTLLLIVDKPPTKTIPHGSLFTDNARVYYKPHSLPSGGVNTVRNSKVKYKKI